jgi:hypothetical protein
MPMAKFLPDGQNRIFVAKTGITEFDVQIDLYSDWKEWSLENENLKYQQALRTVGGDPIDEAAGRYLGGTYFLTNGWKIRPYEDTHRLVINGNLFSEDGSGVTIPTTGSHNVLSELNVSNLVDYVVSDISPTLFIDALKASTWIHSSGTASKNFQDLIVEIGAMANSKIVNSSSGVFDFYDKDESNILFTLVESGLQRYLQ